MGEPDCLDDNTDAACAWPAAAPWTHVEKLLCGNHAAVCGSTTGDAVSAVFTGAGARIDLCCDLGAGSFSDASIDYTTERNVSAYTDVADEGGVREGRVGIGGPENSRVGGCS